MNPFLEKFIKKNFNVPGKALDLGAGELVDANDLKQLGWKAVGVDIKMDTDLEKPFLSDAAPFDLVYSNYVLHKLENRAQLIRTAYDNLKPGGCLFLRTFDISDKQSTSDLTIHKIHDLLNNSGFAEIATEIIDDYDDETGHNHWHRILQATARKPAR